MLTFGFKMCWCLHFYFKCQVARREVPFCLYCAGMTHVGSQIVFYMAFYVAGICYLTFCLMCWNCELSAFSTAELVSWYWHSLWVISHIVHKTLYHQSSFCLFTHGLCPDSPNVMLSLTQWWTLSLLPPHTVCPAGWKPGSDTIVPDVQKSKEFFSKQ